MTSACGVRIRDVAPWLLAPEFGTCVVGSAALAEACGRSGVAGPAAGDLDLAWAVDIEPGEAILRQHGAFIPTTDLNRGRGTLGVRIGTERVEITTFRGTPHGPMLERIESDLARRDMTIGAIGWWLAEDRIVDPFDGVDDWSRRIVRPVGDAAERVREHPIRWIRYFRKAHAFGFSIDRAIRKLDLDPSLTDAAPREAVAGELRAILESTASPGRCLLELAEVGLLARIAPELAPQFDGRPAGPNRYHPEVGQALHLILALEWIVERSVELPAADRYAVRFAVLCHDLGKNLTPPDEFPSHRGHEGAGLPLIDALCKRLPGLADSAARGLARDVCELHLIARGLRELRAGTLAKFYEEHFRHERFRRDLFALAIAADSAGRLGLRRDGDVVAAQILGDLEWICSSCDTVDAAALRAQHPDTDDFRRALHEARARVVGAWLRQHENREC